MCLQTRVLVRRKVLEEESLDGGRAVATERVEGKPVERELLQDPER